MSNFNKWDKLFRGNELLDFTTDRDALLWLKIKSFIRKETINDFVVSQGIELKETTEKNQFKELYERLVVNLEESHLILRDYFEEENQKELEKLDVRKLIIDLYKVQSFDWGGDYNNSLDKYLVRSYVKSIPSYDELIYKLDNEALDVVRKYVINSWYNNWTSILIEHIFKAHPSVLPTVGKVKSVDFFINDMPIDLKVTYVPNGYVAILRKELGIPNESTFLKKQAKLANIPFDKNQSDTDLFYSITSAMKDRIDSVLEDGSIDLFGNNYAESTEICRNALETIKSNRRSIINAIQEDSSRLMKWLYENQGAMRFGAENRLFIVLLDNNKWEDSWKLKRNFDFLEPRINNYLNDFDANNIQKLEFTFNGKQYETYADTLFLIK